MHPSHCGVPSRTSRAGANCHCIWDDAPDATQVWFVRVPEEWKDKNILRKEKRCFQSMLLLLLNLPLAGSWQFGYCEALQVKPLFINWVVYANAIIVVPCRHGTLVLRLCLWVHQLVGWVSGLQNSTYKCSALLFGYAFNLCTYLWLCLLFCISAKKCDEQCFLGPLFREGKTILSLLSLIVLYICWCSFYQPLSARHICCLHLLLCPERHYTFAWPLPSACLHRFGTRRTNVTRVQSVLKTTVKLEQMPSLLLSKCLPI